MSLSLIEELELQVIALSGNDRAHCAVLVQQAIDALKAQPSGVVLPRDPEKSFLEWASGCPLPPTQIQAYRAGIAEVARLNSSPVSDGVKLPDDFVCDSKPLQDLLNATAMLLETPCPDSATYWAAMLANVEALLKPVSDGGADERAAERAANDAHDAALYRYLRDAAHVSLLNKLVRHVELRYGCKWDDEIYGAMSAGLREEVVALKQARAALTASAPNHSGQVRDGWQLVPKVATPEMKSAIWAELDRQGFDSDLVETQSLYYAGIAAAPSSGSQGGDV